MTDPAPTSPDLTQPDLTQPDLTQPDLTSPAPDRDRPTYDAAARQDAGRFRPDDLAARPGDDTSSVARDRQLTAPVAPAELPALRRVQRPGSEDGNAGMDVESWRHGLDLAAEQAASPHHAAAESMPLPPPMPLPVPTPFAADVAAPPPAAPSAAAGGPPHRAAPTAEEVSAHLRHELLLDRERAGSLADLW